MKNELPDNPEIDRTSSPNAPRRAKTLTGMALLLPALLLGGTVWQSQMPQPVVNAGNVMPTRSKRVAQAPTATPAPVNAPRQAYYEIFVPNDDAELVRKRSSVPGMVLTDEDIALDRTELQQKLITGALKKLLIDSADFFPKGAALAGPVTLKGGVVNVNLNRAFAANAESWSSAETTTRVMSIVNTAIATKEQIAGSESSEVRILIQGKPVSTLGPLDTSEPIEGEPVAVSKP